MDIQDLYQQVTEEEAAKVAEQAEKMQSAGGEADGRMNMIAFG